MAKHALVFIHGMGEQTADWHQPALKVLSDAFPMYDSFKGSSFLDFVEPIPVLYSDLFSELRETWKTDVGQIKTILGAQLDAADVPQRQSIEQQIDSVATSIGAGTDTFVWTHAMDVVLYRFFKLVRQAVDIKVANQMLAATDMKFSSWSIIAHSLGTAVTHNTLQKLYTTGLIAGQPPLKTQETRPRVLAMVANVSRVLQLPTVKVFSSKVMPGPALQDRACDTYLNARHVFDPFMYPQPFEPDHTWPTPDTFDPTQYQHIRPTNIALDRLIDVHDLENYLQNPRVHVPIFRGIVGSASISADEFAAACSKFDQKIASNEIDSIRDALEKKLPAKNTDWPTLLQSLFDLTGLRKP